jgi:hypothetical protein
MSRPTKTALASLLALCLTLAAGPAPASAQDRDCFWQGGSRTANIAYPDLGARYWVSAFPLPPGAELILRGRYPQARYFSFNVYDPALRPTDGLPDVDIAPDTGSVNPFDVGARRDAEHRDYAVRIVSSPPPATREPNTIYLNTGGQAAPYGQIIYRVYVADEGLGADGGVGLPEVSMRLPGGRELEQPLVCQARDSAVGPVIDDAHANLDGPGSTPANPGAEDPIRWEAFFNYAQAFSYPVQATPAGAGRDIVPRDPQGGFLSNIDNAYTFALASRGIAPVLVLEGKAPTTPRTRSGNPVMEAGQVRYWSICENEFASQRVVDCLYDEQVVTREDGRFTLVMSTPGARPANARAECGVNWIRWGAQPDGFPILRHMLPSVDFAQAIQNVARAGTETDVIGEYLPLGRHVETREYEALGCPATPVVGPGGGLPSGPEDGSCGRTFVGTGEPDSLRGTRSGERLAGKAGPDRLNGRAGADCIRGGRGRDRIRGGGGEDDLAGGVGADRIRAADGLRDRVDCGRGRDLAIADRRDRLDGCETVRRQA